MQSVMYQRIGEFLSGIRDDADGRTAMDVITRIVVEELPGMELGGAAAEQLREQEELRARVAELQDELRRQRPEVDQLRACRERLRSLESQVAEANERLSRGGAQLADSTRAVEQLRSQVQRLAGERDAAQAEARDAAERCAVRTEGGREKDETISGLRRALAQREEQVADLRGEAQREISGRDNVIEDLQGRLRRLRNQLQSVRSDDPEQVERLEAAIRDCQEALRQCDRQRKDLRAKNTLMRRVIEDSGGVETRSSRR